jgi:hypothetical protein
MSVDGLLICHKLPVEGGDGLLVGGQSGADHRGLLLCGIDLELFEYEVLGDSGRLGLQSGDGVGSGGMEPRPDGEGGEDDERGK